MTPKLSLNNRAFTFFIRFVLPIVAVFLPLLLVSADLAIMPRVLTTQLQLFELFAFCMWVVLVVNVYREVRVRPGLSRKELVLVILPFLVSFLFLIYLIEFAGQSWDYEQYEAAFKAVVANQNPYESTYYLYPPSFAQAMAFVYRVGEWLSLQSTGLSEWLFVFYIHQCLQFFLACLAYGLSLRFADRLGFPKLEGLLIVTGLFLLNYPLIRTFSLNQVNLYVLNAILIALLSISQVPFWAGAAISIGALVKVYPSLLAVPLLGMKKWQALLGMGVSFVVAVLLGGQLAIWRQFIRFYLSFPVERESSEWFRNTSLLSFIRNLIRLLGLPEMLILPIFIVIALGVLVWMAIRFYQREQIFQKLEPGASSSAYRNFGHLLDFSVLSLLLAPSAWGHHFVITIPFALWALALQGRKKPIETGIGIAYIFLLPQFNVFPVSYLRLWGIMYLLWLTPPSILFNVTEVARAWHDDLVVDEEKHLVS